MRKWNFIIRRKNHKFYWKSGVLFRHDHGTQKHKLYITKDLESGQLTNTRQKEGLYDILIVCDDTALHLDKVSFWW